MEGRSLATPRRPETWNAQLCWSTTPL